MSVVGVVAKHTVNLNVLNYIQSIKILLIQNNLSRFAFPLSVLMAYNASKMLVARHTVI